MERGFRIRAQKMRVLLLASALATVFSTRDTLAFFYSWYGTPEVDGKWSHWDHQILPHWTEHVRAQYPGPDVRFLPPNDIHAPFYPAAGLYSSLNASHLAGQLRTLKAAGVSAAVVSWWGRPGVSGGDSQGVLTNRAVELAFEAASAVGGIGVALHLEPYAGRSAESVRADLDFLADAYGGHAGLFRGVDGRPLFFVYDSYHISPAEWVRVLSPGGDLSVRGGAADGVFMGLWLEGGHGADLEAGFFDGGYTYFAAEGFSFGSTSRNWAAMAAEAARRGLLFCPSVGPGYVSFDENHHLRTEAKPPTIKPNPNPTPSPPKQDDSKIRPWNAQSARPREGGEYYRRMWNAALAAAPPMVSVTSFNEWGEGTQIEEAVPRNVDVGVLAPLGLALPGDVRQALRLRLPDRYEDYSPEAPDFYMRLTAEFAAALRRLGDGGDL